MHKRAGFLSPNRIYELVWDSESDEAAAPSEIITLLVVETNRHYHDHLVRLDKGPSPLPDVTEAEMFVFLAITIQMGHRIQDKLTDNWSTTYQFHTSSYSREKFLVNCGRSMMCV
jgi:hypothetical protein